MCLCVSGWCVFVCLLFEMECLRVLSLGSKKMGDAGAEKISAADPSIPNLKDPLWLPRWCHDSAKMAGVVLISRLQLSYV